MTGPANTFGAVVSGGESESPVVTNLAGKRDATDAAATRLRERAERVRRRELDTALGRLEASEDRALTPEERRLVARLSARITGGLVERWLAGLDADEVDENAALALFSE